jgi:hypothetical protein
MTWISVSVVARSNPGLTLDNPKTDEQPPGVSSKRIVGNLDMEFLKAVAEPSIRTGQRKKAETVMNVAMGSVWRDS